MMSMITSEAMILGMIVMSMQLQMIITGLQTKSIKIMMKIPCFINLNMILRRHCFQRISITTMTTTIRRKELMSTTMVKRLVKNAFGRLLRF